MFSLSSFLNNLATFVGIIFGLISLPFIIEHIITHWDTPPAKHTGARPDSRHYQP